MYKLKSKNKYYENMAKKYDIQKYVIENDEKIWVKKYDVTPEKSLTKIWRKYDEQKYDVTREKSMTKRKQV